MLASITPLGERGRGSTWWVTASAFLIGATAAGVAAGAALGAAGAALAAAGTALGAAGGVAMASVGTDVRLAVLAAALVVALVFDAVLERVPGPRRQVDERWLDEYRGWVYGLGYGGQLGLGMTTVVTSAATYVALLAAVLVARPAAGAIVLGCFGALRGLTPLAAAGVRSQHRLLALHRALDRWRGRMRWGAVAAQAGVLVAALALAGA
jgi:hypothetical protein